MTDAFWFGPREQRAFGMYHSAIGASRACAVVLCPPLCHEMLCTHRAYRRLAEQLAARGFPTLRFDYHGTGDSAGDDHAGDRVGAWLATVDHAIDVVRSAGATRVALFGVRIGATLAMFAAARRGDVDALVLVAPSISGAAYLRELRAMHAVRYRDGQHATFRGQRDGDEEAIGFVFRRETIDALERLDVRALDARPAARALVVPRDDLPGREARIVERLTTLGTTVDVVRAPGYAAIAADDPYNAEVPEAIWNVTTTWLATFAADGANVDTCAVPHFASRVTIDPDVAETALRFGERDRLFGILSEPVSGAPSDVAVVIANTGANSRVSPHRLNVTLARRMASKGYGVLRIDLSGIGDSPAIDGSVDNELYAIRSIDDVRLAIDALAERGYRRFVAMGLCAGAFMSFHAALDDDRIAGIALLNPQAFEWNPGQKVETTPGQRTGQFRSTRYYRNRLFRLDTWKRLARGEVAARGIARTLEKRLRARAATVIERAALLIGRDEWVLSDLAQKFATLARRDVRVLVLFDGGEPMIDELGRHLGSFMHWLEARGLQLEIIDDTDHTFAPVWSQERVGDLLLDFLHALRMDAPSSREHDRKTRDARRTAQASIMQSVRAT